MSVASFDEQLNKIADSIEAKINFSKSKSTSSAIFLNFPNLKSNFVYFSTIQNKINLS